MVNLMRVVPVVIALLLSAFTPVQAAERACPDSARLPASPFSDLQSATHRDAVICASWYDLVRGVTQDRFRPAQAVRRGQMAAFLARLIEVLVEQGALTRRPIPSYTGAITAIPQQMRDQMRGRSWREECPVSMDKLVLLKVTHWDFNAISWRSGGTFRPLKDYQHFSASGS
jgi:hypothetical protein